MFNRISKSAALLLTFCNFAYADLHPQAAIKAFNEGVKHFNAKEFNEAIPLFDEAISDDADFAEAYYARGACRHYLKGYDGAIMDLNDAVRLNSDLIDARALRGAVYYETNQWDPAMDDFNYVLQKRPTDAQSLLGRGVVYLKREDTVHAEKDFRTFLKAHPDDPLAPRLRKLIASLSGSPSQEGTRGRTGETASDGKGSSADQPSAAAPRRPSAEAQAMADSLLRNSHQLSDEFSRKVLRGERAEAVGDIRTEPSAHPASSPSGNEAPQIVEPQ